MNKRFDIACIGELNADLVLRQPSAFPVLGREIRCEDFMLTLGSSTAICACVLGALRVKTAFMGRVAKDALGAICLQGLQAYGVNSSYVLSNAHKTGITVALSYKEDRALVTAPGDTINAFHAKEIPLQLLHESRHIHVGSYFMNEKLAHGLPDLFQQVHKLGGTTSLDAGWDDTEQWDNGIFEALRHTDVFFPNEVEVCAIAKSDNAYVAAQRLRAHMPAHSLLVVKLGAHGCIILDGENTIKLPSYPVQAIDTTGAGDSFNAGFLAYWLEGKPIMECGKFATAVGAVSVTRAGGTSDCPRREDAEKLMHGKGDIE